MNEEVSSSSAKENSTIDPLLRFTSRIAFALPLVLALAVFWQTTHFEFVYFDDSIFIYNNPSIQKGLTPEAVQWAFCADLCFDSLNVDYWQPVTLLSRLLDMSVWGLNSNGHHITNLVLHLANVLLLYFILLSLSGGNVGLAVWIAAAFAIHPSQADVVPWVSARKDLLSTFFGFWTFLAYLWNAKKTSRMRYLGALGFYALALMSKPILVTLPLLLLLLDYWPLARVKDLKAWSHLLSEKIGFFILSVTVLAIMRLTNSTAASDAVFLFNKIPISLLQYVRDFIYPGSFSNYETYPHVDSFSQIILASAIFFLCTFLIFQNRRRHAFLCVGWFWFLACLAPVILIRHESRFLPFAILGLLIICAWGFMTTCQKVPQIFRLMLIFLPLGLWSLISFEHAKYWKNGAIFSEYAANVRPDSARLHTDRGLVLWSKGKKQIALNHFTKAVWLEPNNATLQVNLAIFLARDGKPEEAAEHFQIALKLDPNGAETNNNYGAFLANQEKCVEAIGYFKNALSKEPQSINARKNLSYCLLKNGETEAALSEYEKILNKNLNNDSMHLDFGFMLNRAGKYKEATLHYAEALKINPHNEAVHVNWGMTLIHLGQVDEAIAHFKEALNLKPGTATAYESLAKLLLAKGEVDEAEVYYKKALEKDPQNKTIRHHLERLLESKQQSPLNQ